MEITASNTKDFNWKMGLSLGVDVASIFEHPLPIKYRVTASPKVNVRLEPIASSTDIGDKLYLQVVVLEHIFTNSLGEDWGKLYGEPGYISMAWLEKING